MGWTDYTPMGAALNGMNLDRSQNQWAEQDRGNYDLPGFGQRDGAAMGAFGAAQGRDPRTAQSFIAQDSGARADQMSAANFLGGQMRGQNLLSAEQLRQGQMQNVAAQQSLAASARPGQGVGANRMAMNNAAKMGYGLSGQQAMAGIAERSAAAGSYGGMLGQIRGQDLGLNQFNAQQQQQGSQFNSGQYLQQQALNDAQQRGMLGLATGNAQAQQQGGMAYEGDRTNRFNAAMGVPTQDERFLGAAQGASSMAMMGSDITIKEAIEDGGSEADDFMGSVSPSTWEYKQEHKDRPEAGPGRYLGVMAQDLEKTPAGKAAVTDTDKGKVVDFGKLGGMLTAAVARLHNRLAKVEK